ncbi:MAG: hypothetical protein IJZ85_07680 [Lachnospiraceae bacterium]|nr:hypothetical protein [Lachnospiraceae bacterium]
MKIISLIIALGLLSLGIWSFVQKMNCKKQIQGIYVRSDQCLSVGSNISTPVFCYEIASQRYEREAFEAFTGRKSTLKYVEGEAYPIYVNEKRPDFYVLEKTIKPDDFGLILVGIIILFLLCL